jgi:TrmH family RNA methyltransferase
MKKKSGKGKEADEQESFSKRLTTSVVVLLVRPLYPGNVGSVARVMKNFGYPRLGIVSDTDPRTEPEAFWMAHGAQDVLEQASIYPCLDEALEPVELAIGTTSRRGSRWKEALEPEGLVDLLNADWDRHPTALLFGPEDRGLSVKELSRCGWVVRIPTRKECPSMNLSHAVALLCYLLARRPDAIVKHNKQPSVSSEQMHPFFEEVKDFLGETSFLTGDPTRGQTALRRIQRMLIRACPDRKELGLLWAILRHIQKQGVNRDT